MNKGSAKKWVELLSETNFKFDPAQLCYEFGGDYYGCPEGVLALFLDPNPAIAWDGVSRVWDGEQFHMPNRLLKLCKFKTNGVLPVEVDNFESAAILIANNYGDL